MRLLLLLLFTCPSAFAAYTTMTIEGVQQANGVWTAAGVMDTQGFVRKTGQVAVMGQTRNLPVALAADTAAAGALLKGAARLAGPVALAAAAYDVYEWVNSDDDIEASGGEWVQSSGTVENWGFYWQANDSVRTCRESSHQQAANCLVALKGSHYETPTCVYSTPDSYYCTAKNKLNPAAPTSFNSNRKTCTSSIPTESCGTPPLADGNWFNNKLDQPSIPLIISGWNNIPALSTQPTPITSTDFTPFSDWMGQPYFKDGNWFRDRMDVSPAPTSSQPNRVRVDIGPIKLDGMTDPNVKPDDTPASGSTAPKEQTKFCDDNPNSIACAELGTLEDEPITPVEIPFQITPQSPWGSDNANCPAPKVISLSTGGVVEITYQPTCDFLAGIRPAVLALAFLAALYIALGIPVGKGD
ncbi:virulence factor TspB C-terminal domain-related protein [Aeromonas rivuli]|uniref:virulence factor TspB C-terminal domain-related protein n=1 Tax=Aeromonas rivuli TaxID=648794 RepID=UPI000A778ACF|nr:virulence factor TspB C-terminal domain-related protein [Aeromonas rivuli]